MTETNELIENVKTIPLEEVKALLRKCTLPTKAYLVYFNEADSTFYGISALDFLDNDFIYLKPVGNYLDIAARYPLEERKQLTGFLYIFGLDKALRAFPESALDTVHAYFHDDFIELLYILVYLKQPQVSFFVKEAFLDYLPDNLLCVPKMELIVNDGNSIFEVTGITEEVVLHIFKKSKELSVQFSAWNILRSFCRCPNLNTADVIELIDFFEDEDDARKISFTNGSYIYSLVTIFQTGNYNKNSLYAYLQKVQDEESFKKHDAIRYLAGYLNNCSALLIMPEYYPSSLEEKYKKMGDLFTKKNR